MNIEHHPKTRPVTLPPRLLLPLLLYHPPHQKMINKKLVYQPKISRYKEPMQTFIPLLHLSPLPWNILHKVHNIKFKRRYILYIDKKKLIIYSLVNYNKLKIKREKIEECDKKEGPRGLDRKQIKNLCIGNGAEHRESKKQRCTGNETYPTNLHK